MTAGQHPAAALRQPSLPRHPAVPAGARPRDRLRRLSRFLVAVGTLALALPAAATTPPPGSPAHSPAQEITGFGEVEFGTRWEAARRRYPQAQELAEGQDHGAPSIGGPFVRRILLPAQPVPGFARPADVELRFWKNKLWTVVVYVGADTNPAMVAVLSERLGPPDNNDADNPQWTRATTQATAAVKQGWYAVNDRTLSTDAQAWFVMLMRGEWKAPSQAELEALREPTPAPTGRR